MLDLCTLRQQLIAPAILLLFCFWAAAIYSAYKSAQTHMANARKTNIYHDQRSDYLERIIEKEN